VVVMEVCVLVMVVRVTVVTEVRVVVGAWICQRYLGENMWIKNRIQLKIDYLVILCDLFGMVK